MIEYCCEGCGVTVFGFGRDTVPGHGFCATCEWLDEYHRSDLDEFWQIYGVIANVREEGDGKEAEAGQAL
jgi:hypothetical protein